ncbi:hypothetical protein FJR38_14500 [Anabaena sp. UHCC 0253]|uniref:hypothetical protein n=1 Tax=Anabaena sp. UHCC 0253 TaxID=2590019 RepID=UPI001445FD03|nr:hypothetical protein [Anabaena sp. UHCC 0253]MTJ53772.1 hypothetical protein [Anabaena sp. UHCC 0253]
MYWKNCGSPFSVVTVSIFASLAGLITLECPSFAYSQQQPTINTVSKAISANTTEELSLQKNMLYAEARQLLIEQGWQPHLQGQLPNLSAYNVRELFQLGYPEIKDCAGTGEGLCRFEFINGKGKLLVVVTKSQGYGNKNQFIRNWWIEKNPHITQQNLVNKIVVGFYALGGTDQGLEVKGQRYRYYDELGEKPWKSISDLKYITNGVVFDGKNYWCLSTLAPRNQPAVCSANGWIQAILPFVGTRFFNFMGGSGTGQSITIKNDGIAIVKIHGTMNTSVLYEGKFSNPLILKDGFGLLFKDNKVYDLNPSGQISKGCKGEGKLCESDLYQP